MLHLTTEGDFAEALSSLSHLEPLHVLRPAERGLRLEHLNARGWLAHRAASPQLADTTRVVPR